MALASSDAAIPQRALQTFSSASERRPTPPNRDTQTAREIADWNAAVDRRKAAKHAAKKDRRWARLMDEGTKGT